MVFIATGMIDATGPMVSLAKNSFHISNTLASFLPMLGFIMFGIVAIPIGILQDRKSKKYVLKVGLRISLVGLLIPILGGMYGKIAVNPNSLQQFYEILFAILLLGAGAAIIHVSGNPMIRDLSDEGQFSKNLSFAQFFNTIGSSLGFLLPIIMLHAFGLDWSALFPFFAILVLLNLILLSSVKIVEKDKTGEKLATFKSCIRLLKNSYVLMMVLGIFICCGVEISLSSHVPTLLKEKCMIPVEKTGLVIIWLLFYFPILLGRLYGALIMRWISPNLLLLSSTVISLLGISLLFQNSYTLTITGIFLAGLGLANICPLIFSVVIDRLPKHTNELSGLMISAIAGAAFVPPVMGIVADFFSIQTSILVPIICTCYLSI